MPAILARRRSTSSCASSAPSSAWLWGWAGACALGVLNGVARQTLYERRMGERTAHAVSTVTLVGALTAYTAALQRRWPLGSSLVALRIGMMW